MSQVKIRPRAFVPMGSPSSGPISMRRAMPKHEAHFFEAVLERRFGQSTCFLCGCRLTRHSRRDEHVFPKWLQKQYVLWNKTLVLLNGTTIPYRKLTVPCCKNCNSKHLEPFEKIMARAVREAHGRFERSSLMMYLFGLERYSMAFSIGNFSYHGTGRES